MDLNDVRALESLLANLFPSLCNLGFFRQLRAVWFRDYDHIQPLRYKHICKFPRSADTGFHIIPPIGT